MKLIDLQRRMAADLMRPLTRNDNLSRTAKAAEYVAPNDRLTSHERLQIYSRSYWYRIIDSLYDDFPGLRAIIGDEAFHKLSRAYLAAHPSRSFTMRNLGSALEQWLRPRPQYTGGNHARALDMVRLEWAHIEAFDGRSAKPLGPEDLLEPGPELHMPLQPYISLLELHYPVDDLRAGLNSDDTHGTASNAVAAPRSRAARRRPARPRKSSLFIVVHRFGNSVYYRRIQPEEFRILTAIRRGDGIAHALEAGFEGSRLSIDDYQANIVKWFAIWSELGWLCQPTNFERDYDPNNNQTI
jgi:hypothetical protein